MPSKAKAISDVSPIAPSTPETTAKPFLPPSILQSALDRQEQELTDLQTALDARSDEFADRAALIVRQSLEAAYTKAQSRILTVDIPRFFDLEGNGSPSLSPQTLNIQAAQEEPEC